MRAVFFLCVPFLIFSRPLVAVISRWGQHGATIAYPEARFQISWNTVFLQRVAEVK